MSKVMILEACTLDKIKNLLNKIDNQVVSLDEAFDNMQKIYDLYQDLEYSKLQTEMDLKFD